MQNEEKETSAIPKWERKLLEKYHTFLFDCDGVLWRGGQKVAIVKVEGAPDVVKKLMDSGKKVFFVTNNSTKSRKQYVTKISKFGIPIKDSSQVLSSAYAAASYLQSIGFKKKALVIGHEGIELELKEHGISYVNVNEILGGKQWEPKDLIKIPVDPEVGVVVAGMDLTFTYSKSALAGIYCQAEDGLFLPGAGATIAHVSASCQMEAKNVGKPESVMFSAIRSRYPDLDLSGVLMVGDRLNTDMVFGNRGGVSTMVVLTGVTPLQALEEHSYSKEYYQMQLSSEMPI
eukprot:jgi/Bigna1/75339/fgenesh1_pg.34_\